MEVAVDDTTKVALLVEAVDDIDYDVSLAKAGSLKAVSHGIDVTDEVIKRYGRVKSKLEAVLAAYGYGHA